MSLSTSSLIFFFFNDTATTEIYTLSLHDALPIFTDDGFVVLASEAGVLDIDPAKVVRKGRLRPGRIFLVDTARGRIVEDAEIKTELAREHPYADWLRDGLVHLEDLPEHQDAGERGNGQRP